MVLTSDAAEIRRRRGALGEDAVEAARRETRGEEAMIQANTEDDLVRRLHPPNRLKEQVAQVTPNVAYPRRHQFRGIAAAKWTRPHGGALDDEVAEPDATPDEASPGDEFCGIAAARGSRPRVDGAIAEPDATTHEATPRYECRGIAAARWRRPRVDVAIAEPDATTHEATPRYEFREIAAARWRRPRVGAAIAPFSLDVDEEVAEPEANVDEEVAEPEARPNESSPRREFLRGITAAARWRQPGGARGVAAVAAWRVPAHQLGVGAVRNPSPDGEDFAGGAHGVAAKRAVARDRHHHQLGEGLHAAGDEPAGRHFWLGCSRARARGICLKPPLGF